MTTSESERSSRSSKEDGSQTSEERLGAAVAETSEQAADKDEDEVKTDLRSAMVDRLIVSDEAAMAHAVRWIAERYVMS
ncbi:MAG: hypothetical protein EON55_20395, partial [Alphaproteobacteria bacterium]